MITLLSDDFVLQPVTTTDLQLASLAWGFTIGFGFLTTWNAIRQTANIYKRYGYSKLNSPYVLMIWLEITVCLIFSIICWLHLNAIIPPSFAFYFVILTTWALQVQFLLQIIINRVSILLTDRRQAMRLKIGVAIFITAINVSVYCIWIPARLQISERYIYINNFWDRCEKIIYLFVDAVLNWYFIYIVRKRLVNQGLKKYDRLVKFNLWIIGFSLSMDVLIISMMSLQNSFVYMQFHPFAYIVKLNIEMSMADLIAKVSRMDSNQSATHSSHLRSQDPSNAMPPQTKNDAQKSHRAEAYHPPSLDKSFGISNSSSAMELDDMPQPWNGNYEINVKTEVQVRIDEMNSEGGSTKEGSLAGLGVMVEEDTKPLRERPERL